METIGSSYPTDSFITMVLQKMSYDAPAMHNINRSHDFDALKT